MTGIGLLNEKPLHASLKQWYAQPGDQFEVKVDGFVIDIVRGELLLEIQTGNFASLKSKLRKLVRAHHIRLIYPIAREKWIVKQAKDDGGESTRRKSPKRGRVEELFREMVSFPHLCLSSNFSLEVLLITEEELRRYVGNASWRKRGWVTEERRLVAVEERSVFNDVADWQALLPDEIGEFFTTNDLVETMGIRKNLAQKMAYCLNKAGVIEQLGKRGRAKLYGVAGVKNGPARRF